MNFSTFCSNCKMTIRKVTPTTKLANGKKNLTSANQSLACALIDLGAFCPMVVHLPSAKSILPYFSSPRGVAILDCDSHSQAGSTRFREKFLAPLWVQGGSWESSSPCAELIYNIIFFNCIESINKIIKSFYSWVIVFHYYLLHITNLKLIMY